MHEPIVGTLNESPLHASLKEWYREPGDLPEHALGGFVIDLYRSDELIEIQTRNFAGMRKKLDHLLDSHAFRIVHPVAAERFIVKLDDTGQVQSRRRSPKRGIVADVCAELVSFPSLLSHPNFTLEVAMVCEEEVRVKGRSRRRRGWTVLERRLVSVVDTHVFHEPFDLRRLLPVGLPTPFTTADLAAALGRTTRLAREMAYCLRVSEAIDEVGRDRRGILYRS